MAISKQKKLEIVAEVAELLESSKMTVFAQYSGTSVQSLQELRSQAKQSGTVVKIVKNRLFRMALAQNEALNSLDSKILSGQLVYAFNSEDEVAPAQNLANFAKSHPQLKLIGAIAKNGNLLTGSELDYLSSLPTKEQLKSQLLGVLSAPGTSFVNAMSVNLRSIINIFEARKEIVS